MEIIRSKILATYPQIVFGMSTRNGGVSPGTLGLNLSFNVGDEKVNVIENRRRFFGALHIGLDELAMPMQCHSANVLSVKSWGGYENCDALVTGEYGVFLVVSVADCVPIFLLDPVQRIIAGIHAGWRGTCAGVTQNAVREMKSVHNARAENLVAYIGPAAGKCCYDVGDEVAENFNPTFKEARLAGKWSVDLKSANLHQLISEGVRAENVEVDDRCTIHNAATFHSHRREGKNSGRMMGVVGIVR